MPTAYVVLLLANLIYATSYTVTRLVLQDVGPATLALARLTLGSAILVPWTLLRHRDARPVSRSDRWRLFWMGLLGFAGAFALGNGGLARARRGRSGRASSSTSSRSSAPCSGSGGSARR